MSGATRARAAYEARANGYTTSDASGLDDDAARAAPPAPRWRRCRDLVDAILARADERWISLALGGDEIMTVRPGGIVLLIGGTGRGKSSLSITMLVEHARDHGPAIACSLELPADEWTARAIGTRRDASWPDVLRGRVSRDEMLASVPERLVVIEREHGSIAALAGAIETMRAEYPDEPILVAVDYVQILATSDEAIRTRVGAVMRDLDAIARRHRVAMIALSQGSRVASRGLSSGERIGADTTDTGAESADLERWATATLAIGALGEAAEDGSQPAELSIGKGRMTGGDRVLPARYHGRSGLWRVTGDARPAAEVRAERQSEREESQVATLMLAIRAALDRATAPLSDRQLGEAVTGRAALRRQARDRLLADPDSGVVRCGRASGGRRPSYPIWTRARAEAAGTAIHEGKP